MIIRKAEIGDLEICLTLSKQEGENYWTREDFYACLNDRDVGFLVAEEDKTVVGYISGFIVPTKRNEALIHETRVDNNYRGRKVGTKLVKELCEYFFSNGVTIIYAMIEGKLKPFYLDACGFKETGSWIEASKRKD